MHSAWLDALWRLLTRVRNGEGFRAQRAGGARSRQRIRKELARGAVRWHHGKQQDRKHEAQP